MGTAAGPGPTTSVVVCDADPLVRSVVVDLVQRHGAEVVAEADSPWLAIELVERLSPDVVIFDLSLKGGTGLDIVEALQRSGREPPYVIVFTALDPPASLPAGFVDVVRKPDFDALVERLTSGAPRHAERRKATRTVPTPAPAVADPTDFFRMLADARPGDQLVRLPGQFAPVEDVVREVRHAVRTQDRVLRRSDDVLVLLIDGSPLSVHALIDRLDAALPRTMEAATSIDVGDDPIAAFEALTGA